jgi:hypothetical protein
MFEQDWERRLGHLAPNASVITFEAAWQTTVEAIRLVQTRLTG